MDNEKQYFYDYLIKMLSIAKIGLTYSRDGYALVDYKEIQNLTQKTLNNFLNTDFKRPNYFERNVYPTPNVSVRAVILNKDKTKVLLVEEKKDHAYSLPGGWADLYESPSQAIKRECFEEAGVKVKVIRLCALLNGLPFNVRTSIPEYAVIFVCEIDEDYHTHDHEILDVNFFYINNLPTLSKKMTLDNFNKSIKAAISGETIFD